MCVCVVCQLGVTYLDYFSPFAGLGWEIDLSYPLLSSIPSSVTDHRCVVFL